MMSLPSKNKSICLHYSIKYIIVHDNERFLALFSEKSFENQINRKKGTSYK